MTENKKEAQNTISLVLDEIILVKNSQKSKLHKIDKLRIKTSIDLLKQLITQIRNL